MAAFFLVVGATSSILFGIIAAVTDFRDADPSRAFRARMVLVGLASSGLLVFVGTTLAGRQSERITATRHDKVLNAVLREAQRLSHNDFHVVVTIEPEPHTTPPDQLNNEWQLTVALTREGTFKFPKNTWAAHSLLNSSGMSLRATRQTALVRTAEINGLDVIQTEITFTSLVGDLKQFVDAERWNGALLEVHMEAPRRHGVLRQWADEDSSRRYSPSEDSIAPNAVYTFPVFDDYGAVPPGSHVPTFLSVRARADVYAGTRHLGHTVGLLAAVGQNLYDDDLANIKFPLIQVPKDAFATFDSLPAQRDVRSIADVLAHLFGTVLSISCILVAIGWLLSAMRRV